MTPEQ